MNPLSWLTGALGGVWGYVAALAFGAVLAGAGVGWVVHKVDHDSYVQLQLADQTALTEAVALKGNIQKAQDIVALNAAVKEAKAQDALDVKYVTIERKVPIYVTKIQEAKSCLTVGFYRLFVAASQAADPDTFQLAPGQSNDDCANITETAMANWFTPHDTGFAAVAFKNAEQLNALEQSIRDLTAAHNKGLPATESQVTNVQEAPQEVAALAPAP